MTAKPIEVADWEGWRPDPCPDISDLHTRGLLWDSYAPPWRNRANDRPVDQNRTARLGSIPARNREVRVGKDERTYQGHYGGMPFQRLDQVPTVDTKVHEAEIRPFTKGYGMFPSTVVPLPDADDPERNKGPRTRRYGDPTAADSDAAALLIDPEAKRYYELSAFGPLHPMFHRLLGRWRCSRVRAWRLDRDWTDPAQPSSVTAANIPLLPMLPTFEEYETSIEKALQLVAPGYAPEKVWPATGTDPAKYLIPGHPLRAGERLRLRRDVADRLLADPGLTRHDRALIHALVTYGVILCDRTSPDVGFKLRQPQDPRLDLTIVLSILDFEVVAPDTPPR